MSIMSQLGADSGAAGGATLPEVLDSRLSTALNKLLSDIQACDPHVRTKAWQAAGQVGALAVQPLAKVGDEGELEVSRAAKQAMWQIVRYVGRPGGDSKEKYAVVSELLALLSNGQSVPVRRETIRMVSEIGGNESVAALSPLLSHGDLREDARMALERIPGEESLQALESALESGPDDFKPNLAQSLRARGAAVRGFPCRKLVPTKQTRVKPRIAR